MREIGGHWPAVLAVVREGHFLSVRVVCARRAKGSAIDDVALILPEGQTTEMITIADAAVAHTP